MYRVISILACCATLIAGCATYPQESGETDTLEGLTVERDLGAILGNQSAQVASAEIEARRQPDDQSQGHAENARLLEELRQRGIDVRETERGVVINLPDVLFSSGQAQLTSSALQIVKEIAEVLKRAPSRRLSIEGHTDSLGTIDYNHRLSDARARAVAQELESNGVAGRLITTHAFGETTPLASNKTEQGRKLNRRVEVIIPHV